MASSLPAYYSIKIVVFQNAEDSGKNVEIKKPVLLKEVDMFQSLEPSVKKKKKKKLVPKPPKTISKSRESNKSSSPTLQPEKGQKGSKRVTWAETKSLVEVKHFEVDEDERRFKIFRIH